MNSYPDAWWGCTREEAAAWRERDSLISVPTVIVKENGNPMATDLFSALMAERVIDITGPIDDATQKIVTGALFFLAGQSKKEITLCINSPGGSVTAGTAIIDMMESVQRLGVPIATRCNGMAASMAFVILAAGTKGRRSAQKRSRAMMHQPSISEVGGKATELRITVDQIEKSYDDLAQLIAELTGHDFEEVKAEMVDDKWFSAIEARDYGVVDIVIGVDDLD